MREGNGRGCVRGMAGMRERNSQEVMGRVDKLLMEFVFVKQRDTDIKMTTWKI